jgi:RpiR family transcriptional regulator, carbohydrate utilization regulator
MPVGRPPRNTRTAAVPESGVLLERVAAALDTLRPSERRVGEFVLRHPNQAIELSFGEVARRAGVSQPTVARFCRAMGFTGLRELKLRLAKSLARGVPLADGVPFVHRDVQIGDSMAEIGAKVFDRSIAALVTVRNHLDPTAITAAVQALRTAKRIEFYGLGNSGIVALDAQHKFFRLGVHTAAYADAHMHAMAASMLRPGDVVVAISGSGRTRDLIRSVEIAREAGATAIAITIANSPLATASDIAVLADVPEDPDVYAPMTSRLAHLAIFDVLAVGVAVARGPELTERLQRAKAVISEKRLGEL